MFVPFVSWCVYHACYSSYLWIMETKYPIRELERNQNDINKNSYVSICMLHKVKCGLASKKIEVHLRVTTETARFSSGLRLLNDTHTYVWGHESVFRTITNKPSRWFIQSWINIPQSRPLLASVSRKGRQVGHSGHFLAFFWQKRLNQWPICSGG